MGATTTSNLSGIRKTAILCLALKPEESRQILAQFSPEQLEAVTREIALIGTVEAGVVQRVLEEFNDTSIQTELSVEGGIQAAGVLLRGTLDAGRASEVLERIREKVQNGLAGLERLEPRLFQSLLLEEHPQTVAVILSHLDLKVASKAIEKLPAELASDVVYRMAELDKIQPETMAILEEGVKSKTDLSLSEDLATAGDPAKVAKLLTMTTGGRDEEILKKIQERNEVLAARLKALMFVFEDLLLIDGKGIQRILRDTDNATLGLALKGASNELREHILGNMSQRAAAALREDMELMGAVRVKEVEQAQQGIMEQVRQLEEAGEIVVPREGGSDEFIS